MLLYSQASHHPQIIHLPLSAVQKFRAWAESTWLALTHTQNSQNLTLLLAQVIRGHRVAPALQHCWGWLVALPFPVPPDVVAGHSWKHPQGWGQRAKQVLCTPGTGLGQSSWTEAEEWPGWPWDNPKKTFLNMEQNVCQWSLTVLSSCRFRP